MKRIFAFIGFLLAVEGAGRLVAWLRPWGIQRPYTLEHQPAYWEVYPKSRGWIRWQTNRFGARAELDPGGKPVVALFGGSNVIGTHLSHEDTWGYHLGRRMGYHVENYGWDGGGSAEATAIAEDLVARGRRFDLILAMVQPNEGAPGEFAYRDHLERGASPGDFQWAYWFRNRFLPWWSGTFAPLWAAPSPVKHPRDPGNRSLIRGGHVQFEEYWDDPAALRRRFESLRAPSRRFFEVAEKLSDRIVFLTQPVAWDEDARPEVLDRWSLLLPVPEQPGRYISFASHARIRRLDSSAVASVARERGIPVLDLDRHIRGQLSRRSDLFWDHIHFTPVGSDHVARWLSAALRRRPQTLAPRGLP